MKNTILAVILLMSFSWLIPANAEWVEIGGNENYKAFIDYSSIRAKQDGSVFWQAYINALKDEINWTEGGVNHPYRSLLIQYHTHCITPKNKVLSFHKEWAMTYSSPDLKGLRENLFKHGIIVKTTGAGAAYAPLMTRICNYR